MPVRLIVKVRVLLLGILLVIGGVAAVPNAASADWLTCNVREVGEFSNRVHVRCWNSIVVNGNTVTYLAIGKTDTTMVARFISLATSSLLSGKPFSVDVPVSATGNVSGCGSTNCRTPSVWLLLSQ